MKLNKLTSAVSVSLLAVALTACGSDDDAPIINNTATTTPTTPAPTPAPTPTPVDNTANIAALTAAFKAAGLSDAKAAELAAANPTITAGGAEFNALVNANKPAPVADNNVVSTVVDRANPFIGLVDTNKQATVTASQYSRQPGSNFDRRANPMEDMAGALGGVGTDDPTKQNPYLSNFVLGVEVVGNKAVAIDSTGEMAVQAGAGPAGTIVQANRSPYIENNGLRYVASSLNDGPKAFTYAAANAAAALLTANDFYDMKTANHGALGAGTGLFTPGQALAPTIYTIQQVNARNSLVSTGARDAAWNAVTSTTPPTFSRSATGELQSTPAAGGAAAVYVPAALGLNSGLVVYNSASPEVGNAEGARMGYKVPVYGVEENIYDVNGVALNAVNDVETATTAGVLNSTRNNIFLAKEAVQYSGNNFNTTAVTGTPAGPGGVPAAVIPTDARETFYLEKYRDAADTLSATGTVTSANTAAGPNNILATPTATTNNLGLTALSDAGERHLANPVANNLETRIFGKNYRALEAGATGNQTTENSYNGRYNSKGQLSNIGVTTLHHVQYGRLTNNIDVLDNKTANSPQVKVYRQFQQHGADNTVDTYFYRGTNHTTLANMEELKAKGGTLNYYGHALTYGVGPKVAEEAKPGTIPTSYGIGNGSEATIGNFVQATYDIAKGNVKGSVYNFINSNLTATTNNNANFKKQDLIEFSGDVYGNTITGTATKLGVNENGTFTGSFFGPDAQELGGSISSIKRAEGYTSPKWGAVFGATKGSSVDNFNTPEQ